MERWAPIWETRPRETSVGPPRRRLRRSGLVAHLPAHLGEEPPLGRRETLDAPRRDLVEHTIDLGLGGVAVRRAPRLDARIAAARRATRRRVDQDAGLGGAPRSEEHTSELQSLTNLVCRLLLEKKKKKKKT